MSRISKLLAFLSRASITGLALAFVIVYLWPKIMGEPETPPENAQTVQAAPASYADAVNRAAPAVVSIYTRAFIAPSAENSAFLNQMRLRAISSEGSGVIMREDGYILTNEHVIRGVSFMSIVLWDGRIVPARVVGADPSTDLAVLKVDLEGLPVATVKKDGAVSVGDVVLAIGNSLGLSHTVSLGIVSATGRNDLRSLLYQDFIQTDAAINSGNSGGALVDTTGALVGINTRYVDGTKGAQNIGFAIPITLAHDVMDQIIDYGTVRRGWMGADYSDLAPRIQPDGTAVHVGIGVREVQRGGPAWNAGIRPGDLILTLDGEPVSDASRFRLAISQRVPGSKVELEVQRGNEPFQTYATLIQQPPL